MGSQGLVLSPCPRPLRGQGEYGKGEDGILRGVYFKHFFLFPFSKKMKAQTESMFAWRLKNFQRFFIFYFSKQAKTSK